MREILFRGKNEDNGEWVEGYYSVIIDDYSGVEECAIFPFNDTRINGDGAVDNYCFVVPETVGRYTGLTDKEGHKIFEGDIVQYNTLEDFDCQSVVKYGRYEQDGSSGEYKKRNCIGFYAEVDNFTCPDWCENKPELFPDYLAQQNVLEIASKCEVIGNIYDNHEPLNNQPKPKQKKEIWANAVLSNGEILFWSTGRERLDVNDFFKYFVYAGYGDKYVETHKLELVKKKFEVDEDDVCANNRVFEVDARNFYRQFRISPDCKGKKPY